MTERLPGSAVPLPGLRPLLYVDGRTACTFADDSANAQVPGDRYEMGLNILRLRVSSPQWRAFGARPDVPGGVGAAHAAADRATHRSPSDTSRDLGCRDSGRLAGVLPAGARSNNPGT